VLVSRLSLLFDCIQPSLVLVGSFDVDAVAWALANHHHDVQTVTLAASNLVQFAANLESKALEPCTNPQRSNPILLDVWCIHHVHEETVDGAGVAGYAELILA